MNSNRTYTSSTDTLLDAARKSRQERQRSKKAKTHDRLAEFMSADVTDDELGIIPEGYGGITYLALFIFLPEIVGIMFMFFYVSEGSFEAYKTVDSSYLLTWVIGYEIVAGLTLLLIFKKAIFYVFGK